MPIFLKLHNWMLLDLSVLRAVGKTSSGELMTSRVDLIDWENQLMVTADKIYRLGDIDKVWAKTDNVILVNKVIK